MGPKKQKSRLGADNIRLFIYGCLITLVPAIFTVISPSFFQYFYNKSYDMMMRALPNPPGTAGMPVIVGIDDESLAEYGQWPWPRYILARLIEKIGECDAASIGLDMLFPEPDRTSLSVAYSAMSSQRSDTFTDSVHDKPQFENDQLFANALRVTPSVLGYQFKFDANHFSNDDVLHPLKYAIRQKNQNRRCQFTVAGQVVHSLPILMNAAGASGFVNALIDPDGVLRRSPLLISYNDRIYPSLSLASIIRALGNEQVRIENAEDGLNLQWKDRQVPLDSSGFMMVHFRKKDEKFPHVSAGDILSGRIPGETLNGKMVFIGVTASGMGDRHLSPLGAMIHGTQVHANIVDNILTGDFIRKPAWAPGAELVLVVVCGILSAAALAAGGALWCIAFTLIAGTFSGFLFYWLFLSQGIFLSPVMPLSTLLINFTVLNTIKYGLEEHKVRQRSMELILSQDVAILSLSALVETRDKETGHHILRTQRYVKALALHLKRQKKFRKVLDDQAVELLYKSSPLHDIGKVGIPDRILNKPGKLTHEEFEEMKAHAVIGGQTIKKAADMVKGKIEIPYFKYAYEMAISHHEKWDGSGYPYGLKGEEIPLSGRLMALADIYDALTSQRVYKSAHSHESARQIILEEKGQHLDPEIVDAFIKEQETFKRIAQEFRDIK